MSQDLESIAVTLVADGMLGVEPHLADPIDFTIPRCVADRDEALAIIRQYHEQWIRERASMQQPAVGSGGTMPRNQA